MVHLPPTGKHCPNRDNIGAEHAEEQGPEVLPLLARIGKHMDDMEKQMREWGKAKDDTTREDATQESELERPDSDESSSEPGSGPATTRDNKKG